MTSYREISQGVLHQLLDYDPNTGLFVWKPRARGLFSTDRIWKSWNATFAGKPALRSKSKRGYYVGAIFDTRIPAHQAAFCWVNGYYPKEVDHENGNPLDNRSVNLLDSNRSDQMKNRRLSSNNTSGQMGVVYLKDTGKWLARISSHGRLHYIGKFSSKKDAIAARKNAEQHFNYNETHGRL